MFTKKKNKKMLALVGVVGMIFLQIFPTQLQAAQTISSLSAANGSVDAVKMDALVSSAANKASGPMVELIFKSSNNFKAGSVVTATATEGGFLDSAEKHYFTWYLKHPGCDLTSGWWKSGATESSGSKIKTCDLDGDNIITPNDWKITASRIIVKGDFIKAEDTYKNITSPTGGDAAGGTESIPSVTDKDEGWVKNFTRDDDGDLMEENDKDAPNCYVQQGSSGISYELRGTEVDFNSCPDGYHPACIKNITANCNVLNPLFSSNPVPLLCLTEPTKSDPVQCPYPKSIENGFSACAVNHEDTNANIDSLFSCTVANETDMRNYKTSLACEDSSEIPLCTTGADPASATNTDLTDLSSTPTGALLGRIFQKVGTSSENETNGVCDTLAKANTNILPLDPPPAYLDNTQANVLNESCSYLASGLVNGIKTDNTTAVAGFTIPSGTTIATANPTLNPTCTFTKGENLCKHLFPYFPEKTATVKGSTIDLSNEITGDGKFTIEEKEFWGADPTVASTNRKGKDEANIMGLGVNSFSWTYMAGDEVGVVVEGTAAQGTEHNDSSKKTMWAFSKGTCSELEETKTKDIETGERAFYMEDGIGILTTNFDLDRCLEENLVEPDNGGASNMKIDLKATPVDPINDPSGSGDIVNVSAGVQNVENLSKVYYEWSIEISDSGSTFPPEDAAWTDITTDMVKYSSLSEADRRGLGKNMLNFLLNIPTEVADPNGEGIFYLRVRVVSTEQTGAGSQTAKGSIIIKVSQQGNQIMAYAVTATESGSLDLTSGGSASGLICNDLAGKSICSVTKNEIVGIMIPNEDGDLSGFEWKVNGVSMTCSSDVSPACGAGGNVLFFPILGNVGESINVIATGLSKKTGTFKISRYFVIVEPQIQIISTDTTSVWPKLIGYYKDLDGARSPDYSSQVFETSPAKTVTLNAVVYSAWSYQGREFSWTIDGQIQNDSSDTMSFVVDRNVGDNYNIGLVLIGANTPEQEKQANNLRKALLKNWNISPEDDYLENLDAANIQINVVDAPFQTITRASQPGIFASLITNLPEQIMFLLKITLTSFMLIFSMSLLFYFIPESFFEKTKNKPF